MIVCYDLETTGLNPKIDSIIQISLVKFDPDKNYEIIDERNWYIKPDKEYNISLGAYEKHKISKEFLEKNGISFQNILEEFLNFIKDCDILSYNGNNFDIKFLSILLQNYGISLDMNRSFFDAYAMECLLNPRNLSSIYKKYTGKDMINAHNALNDVKATIEVFKNQIKNNNFDLNELKKLPENNILSLSNSIRKSSTENNTDIIVFNNGKYKDIEVINVIKNDPEYFKWWWNEVADKVAKNNLNKYWKNLKNKNFNV